MSDKPSCWCLDCDARWRSEFDDWRRLPNIFITCPDCGNKRCPKASDHRLACSGSNEPGQPGSVYR